VVRRDIIGDVTLRADTTILVVEDERIIALDIRRMLLRHGYRVVATAANGADALRLAREFLPRIVLMDLRLQGAMDGIATAQQLRAAFEFGLIFLSGGRADRADAELAKPVAFLQKPFHEQQLLAAVELAEASLQRPATALEPTTADESEELDKPSRQSPNE
jgi:CheY-like chemotaxis protein